MKAVIVFVLFLACANASIIETVQKLAAQSVYIANGKDAKPNAAPYIVSLGKNHSLHFHICGGTIINKEWVLTAGHCIDSDPTKMGVVAGLHKRLETNSPTVQKRKVDFGKVHPDFSGEVGPYDIGLLHVYPPFEFTESVQSAVLPALNSIPSGNVTLYGWGLLRPFGAYPAKTLQTLKTEIVEWNKCKDTLPDSTLLDPKNVCTLTLGKGTSACSADSGGPLVREQEKSLTELLGIVSWASGPCGEFDTPTVYTRVSAYIDWIVDIQSAYYKLF